MNFRFGLLQYPGPGVSFLSESLYVGEPNTGTAVLQTSIVFVDVVEEGHMKRFGFPVVRGQVHFARSGHSPLFRVTVCSRWTVVSCPDFCWKRETGRHIRPCGCLNMLFCIRAVEVGRNFHRYGMNLLTSL